MIIKNIMPLPKEIQNLILTRYYFNQWKEKIEKVNHQYRSISSIKKCRNEICLQKSCKYIYLECCNDHNVIYNVNYRNYPLDRTHFRRDSIYITKVWPEDESHTFEKLPTKYYFSSGDPNPENIDDYLFYGRNPYKYNSL